MAHGDDIFDSESTCEERTLVLLGTMCWFFFAFIRQGGFWRRVLSNWWNLIDLIGEVIFFFFVFCRFIVVIRWKLS